MPHSSPRGSVKPALSAAALGEGVLPSGCPPSWWPGPSPLPAFSCPWLGAWGSGGLPNGLSPAAQTPDEGGGEEERQTHQAHAITTLDGGMPCCLPRCSPPPLPRPARGPPGPAVGGDTHQQPGAALSAPSQRLPCARTTARGRCQRQAGQWLHRVPRQWNGAPGSGSPGRSAATTRGGGGCLLHGQLQGAGARWQQGQPCLGVACVGGGGGGLRHCGAHLLAAEAACVRSVALHHKLSAQLALRASGGPKGQAQRSGARALAAGRLAHPAQRGCSCCCALGPCPITVGPCPITL